MTAPAQPAPTTARTSDAIDPAHAWILGIVVDDDGQFPRRRSPGGRSARTSAGAPGRRAGLTCPDYCELEHDQVDPAIRRRRVSCSAPDRPR